MHRGAVPEAHRNGDQRKRFGQPDFGQVRLPHRSDSLIGESTTTRNDGGAPAPPFCLSATVSWSGGGTTINDSGHSDFYGHCSIGSNITVTVTVSNASGSASGSRTFRCNGGPIILQAGR